MILPTAIVFSEVKTETKLTGSMSQASPAIFITLVPRITCTDWAAG